MQNSNRFPFGVAYYPEHWPEERWPEDVRLMKEAGLTVVRMGEFAWSSLEPRAGVFAFTWLERAISLLAEAGIDTVLGTPTAAPPAWLIQAHPGILPVAEDGRRVQFGNRRHYCPNSPDFHQAVRRIVAAMGKRFGGNPHVIGWQLDNEYGRVCYCDACRERFHHFLQAKFETLDNLNQAWTTRYWSQTYSEWEQIPLPIGRHNPGLLMAFHEFITEIYRRYQAMQIETLRPHLPAHVWITHNFMGRFDRFDPYALAQDLDLASWDWYIGQGHMDYTRTGAMHDAARGYKQRNFWVMETQPASVDWAPVNNKLNLGEARLMAWHAIAHGADALLYWQWRPARNGQEQYHGSLIDQSGQPRPFYAEAQWLGRELARVGELLAGSTIPAQVALLLDFKSRWSIQAQPHHRDFDYVEHLLAYYRPCLRRNAGIDIIPTNAKLDEYRLVIAPALIIQDEEQVERLREFVRTSGHLILTSRCGMKDEYDALLPRRQPGLLAEFAGVEVEEYYALDQPVPVQGNWFSGEARLWAERLKPLDEDTVTIARYGPSNGWLDDQIAVSVHPYGRGLIYYVGAFLDDDALFAMLKRMLHTALVRPPWETPEGIEIGVRRKPDGQNLFIVLNHKLEEQTISLPWAAYDHITQTTIAEELTLIPYGVAVLTKAG